jgi:trimeric autotransporter adhesin
MRRLRNVPLAGSVSIFLGALAASSSIAHAQVTFLANSADREFPGPEPVCVHDSGKSFGSGANDCSDSGGQSQITGIRVGDSANSITIDSVGANNVGVLFVGTGTHQTTLDGSNGNINLAGTLSISLQGGIDVNSPNSNLNFGGSVLHGVATPVLGTDAANKAYVDSQVNGGNKSFTTLNVTSTSTFGGLATFNGGVKVNGNTQTTSLTVDQDATVGGKLTVTGLVTMNGGASVQNGLNVTGGTTTDTLLVTGNSNVNGNQTIGGTQTVTGQSFLNGGATISNNLTVSSGTNVDMGGNVVHNVGTPVLGTDAANKAYVDTGLSNLNNSLSHRIDKAFDGTAIALALSTPVFQPGQKFVIQGGWGNFEGANAVGFSAAGLLARNTFGPGSTVTLSGGVGAGTNTGSLAGRGAVSIGW